MTELARAVLVAGVFGLLLAAAEGWHRWKRPPVEWTRKLAHFTGGLVIAAFPWLFRSPLTVLGLGLLFAVVLGVAGRLRLLRGIHGVERRTHGDMFYLLAVCLLFWVGHRQPVPYLISVLVLVAADSAAALLGSRYGKRTYSVEGERRTLEGSGVFLVTAFLSAHLPLVLLTDLNRGSCVLVALYVAVVATGLEALGRRGSDNLMVPLATFALLARAIASPAWWLGVQLLLLGGIGGLFALAAWRTRRLPVAEVTAVYLLFFTAHALGGGR